MKKTHAISLVAATLLAACSLDVSDLNNPGLTDFEKNPTRPQLSAAATGLLLGNRLDYAEANGYVAILGILGREAYSFDAADPRFITELLEADQLNSGSPRFGGNFWAVPYQNIRNGNILLSALENASEVMSPEEIEAVRGYTKTIQALDFLTVINTRDFHGAAIDVGRAIGDGPAPLVSKNEVFEHISKLLDEGATHLANAGADTAFPFGLSSGFAGFTETMTFLKFNRAMAARTFVYRGQFQSAMTALEGSFLKVDETKPEFEMGVYHVYGIGNGDRTNGLIDPNILAHPRLLSDAPLREDGSIDLRARDKLFVAFEKPRELRGLSSNLGFAQYQNPKDPKKPAPIIRNEELILLRAEAQFELGLFDEAVEDINFIREISGGLEARHDLTEQNFVQELLLQRRYSLMLEGHRWIDARRHKVLSSLNIDLEGHTIHEAFPIPVQELDPR